MSRHRELKKVSDLFEKYKTILKPPQRSVEKAFVEAVEEVIGLSLPVEKVTYTVSTKTISLAVPSIVKHEVLLHKGEVLAVLQKRLGEKGATLTVV